MSTPRHIGLGSSGLVILALTASFIYAPVSQATNVSDAVVVGGAAPQVTWAVPGHARAVSGVAKGKDCKIRVSGDEALASVKLTVAGKKGAKGVAHLLPSELRRIKQQAVKDGAFGCAVDTRVLPNGPVKVVATAIDASGKKRSASKEFVVANPVAPTTIPATTVTPSSSSGSQWFSPTSIWNRELQSNAPLAAKSSSYVSELVRQVGSSGPWINTNEYSVPVYTVPASQPSVKVIQRQSNSYSSAAMNAAFAAVPVPSDAQPAAGTDKHMVVYQPSTDKMWEFWDMEKVNGQWTAQWGAAIQNVSTNKGYIDSTSWTGAESSWGATASSLPLAGGLMKISELEAGQINHALALAIPEPSPSFVWPAQRSDGYDKAPSAIPEGTIFRLPASLNVASLHLPKLTEEMALAAQRYGIVVRDVSGCVCFYGEDPTPAGGNPYNQIFEGKYPSELLAHFPFASLQAVQPGV